MQTVESDAVAQYLIDLILDTLEDLNLTFINQIKYLTLYSTIFLEKITTNNNIYIFGTL